MSEQLPQLVLIEVLLRDTREKDRPRLSELRVLRIYQMALTDGEPDAHLAAEEVDAPDWSSALRVCWEHLHEKIYAKIKCAQYLD